MGKLIYTDNAATTPLDKEVLNAMMPYLTEYYGNASSIYSIGRQAKQAITLAREQVSNALNCSIDEVYFTSGGTESDNWAILGIAQSYQKKGKHIISSKIEHHAVLHALEYLEKNGYEVTYLDVDQYGVINLEQLKNAIRTDTILITIMMANNEIGTIQPVDEIGAIARQHGVIFHTDAVQAVGHLKIDLNNQPIDLLSLSAHKFNGPKGIGVLYVKKGIRLPNYIYGGGQERGKRPGTENTAGIVGLGAAIELATKNMEQNNQKVIALRNYLINEILKIPYTRLNGHPTQRLPGNANFSIEFIEGESLLLMLDFNGICASSGSACTSGDLDPSHVLLAIGLEHEIAHGSLRLSLSHHNTKEEIDFILATLPGIVQKLRDMSPLYERIKNKER